MRLLRGAGAVFFFTILLAVLVRVYRLDIPIVEPFNSLSRQAICATVARNFYKHGFNLFYPEIDEGPGPYLYNAELPLNTYLMAIGYKLAGGARESVARLISVIFSFIFLGSFYSLVRRALDLRTARIAFFIAAFSPLSVALSRSLQPDIAMLSLGVAAIDLFYRHLETQKARFVVFSGACFLAAVALKIYALYFFIPMLYLAWHFEGSAFLRKPKYYLFALSVLPALGWYICMARAGQMSQLNYQPYHYFPDDARAGISYFDFWTRETLRVNAKFIALHLLTPAGTVLWGFGFFRKSFVWTDKLFYVWTAAVALYLLAVWPTAVYQSYYLISFLPPAAYFAARGLTYFKNLKALALCCAVIFLGSAGYYYQKLYFIPEPAQKMVDFGKYADQTLPVSAKVVTSYGSSPILLYYANRKGWTLNLQNQFESDDLILDRLKIMQGQGAQYYLISQKADLKSRPSVERYLHSHFQILTEGEDGILFRMT